MDSELDSKSDSWTLNWLRPPPCCACFLGSPAPSWYPTCPSWSTPWFLKIIKLLASHLFSRSLANEHNNEFTWRRSCYARDLIIDLCTSIGRVVVSNVVMSTSGTLEGSKSDTRARCWRRGHFDTQAHTCWALAVQLVVSGRFGRWPGKRSWAALLSGSAG
jgi:hypothetical protein